MCCVYLLGNKERALAWSFCNYGSFSSSDKYSSQFGGGSQYAYFHEEDETSFQLVDTAKTQKTAYQRNRMRFAQVQQISDEQNVYMWTVFSCSVTGWCLFTTEKPAQRQGPQEPDPIQHADAPKKCKAKGEVRSKRSVQSRLFRL